MLDLRIARFRNIVDKYRVEVVQKISDPDAFTDTESNLHTEYLLKSSRGDKGARNYVKDKLYSVLENIISDEDKKVVNELVFEEIRKFNEKIYEICNIDKINNLEESKITYYQLCSISASSEQLSFINQIENNEINSLEVLANEIFKKAYGADVIDELLQMKINNVEVHDINKIRVELSNGKWYTIKDYVFRTADDIRAVATRLLSQESGSDLTDEKCERESMLADGSRITIALKPAAYENYIFIKKFDSFNVSQQDMLDNKTISKEMLDDLMILAEGRANSIIIGGVNTGKSTFIKMYAGLFPKQYKIGLIDSSRDTDLKTLYPDRDIVTLYETPTYSLNDQFSRLLRANRHILMISEARSFEIEQMIKGMTRGNSGSCCTLHTTDSNLVVDNIGYMCLENGIAQDMRVLRSRISAAVDIIIRIRHFEDTGLRIVDEITELVPTGNLDDPFELKKIWYWDSEKKEVVRNTKYIPSKGLQEKLSYFGCSDYKIKQLIRGQC